MDQKEILYRAYLEAFIAGRTGTKTIGKAEGTDVLFAVARGLFDGASGLTPPAAFVVFHEILGKALTKGGA